VCPSRIPPPAAPAQPAPLTPKSQIRQPPSTCQCPVPGQKRQPCPGTAQTDRSVVRGSNAALLRRRRAATLPTDSCRVDVTDDATRDGSFSRSGPLAEIVPPTLDASGARQPGPPPPTRRGPVRVERRVSSRGGIQVIGQRIRVGMGHARRTVTVEVDQQHLRRPRPQRRDPHRGRPHQPRRTHPPQGLGPRHRHLNAHWPLPSPRP
jgi:hypothetical protein